METTTIKGREYRVTLFDSSKLPSTTQYLLERGWDGKIYYLEGKRGALYLAYKSAKTGEFSIV